jgi:hypothetical protein
MLHCLQMQSLLPRQHPLHHIKRIPISLQKVLAVVANAETLQQT